MIPPPSFRHGGRPSRPPPKSESGSGDGEVDQVLVVDGMAVSVRTELRQERPYREVDLEVGRPAPGVGRVRAADTMVAVAFVAGIVVTAVRSLTRRVLVVGVADATGTWLAVGVPLAVAVP